jgi:lambda family phage portal protein
MLSKIRNYIQNKLKKYQSNYTGASTRRSLRSWTPRSTSPNREIEFNRPALMHRSRDLFNNNPLGRGAIENLTSSTIGAGLQLQSRIDREYLNLSDAEADSWERNTHREFNILAMDDRIDCRHTSNFYDLQELIFQNFLTSGEVFVLLPNRTEVNQPYNLRVNVIESELVQTPSDMLGNKNIVNGIEYDSFGSPIAYYILDRHPDDVIYGLASNQFKRVTAYGKSGRRNVLHIFKPERPGQSRGLPFLTPVINTIKQISKYSDSYIQKQIVNSLYTVFIRTDAGLLPDTNLPMQDRLPTTDQNYEYELAPGAIIGLAPGEEIQTATPGGSDPAFDTFVMAQLKQIAIGINIPFEIFINHFQASYSASRGALLKFDKLIKQKRFFLENHFCKPVYKEFLTEAIMKNRITAQRYFDDISYQSAWLGSVWNGSTLGQIDPVKETSAYQMQVSSGFITRQDATSMLNGSDWESNMSQIKSENTILAESNMAANTNDKSKEIIESEDEIESE